MKKTISVLLPTYNEEENVEGIYTAVRDILMQQCPDYNYEILFIDNKSKDRTREILRKICAKDKNVKVIFNTTNFGQFNSPYHGMLQTTGDCTITMCSDFQDPPELIPQFVREWENGYKVVIGIKSKTKESLLFHAFRGLYYKIIRKISRCDQIEQFTGFGLYDKSFLDVLRNMTDAQPYMRGIVAELGPERKEIQYVQQRRRAGKTHNNFFTLYDAAMVGFTSYTKAGLRVATFAGFLISIASFLCGLIYLILKLFMWDEFSAGSAPSTIGQFFLGGVQLFFLGFLGEYVLAINARVMNRPLVVEEERINFLNEKAKDAAASGAQNVETILRARRLACRGSGIAEIAAETGLPREAVQLILHDVTDSEKP